MHTESSAYEQPLEGGFIDVVVWERCLKYFTSIISLENDQLFQSVINSLDQYDRLRIFYAWVQR